MQSKRPYQKRRLTRHDNALFTFGDMLRCVREARGLTIDAVAKKMRCTRKAVSKIEQGCLREVSMKKVVDYADAVGAYVIAVPWTIPAGVDLRSQNVETKVTGHRQTLGNLVNADRVLHGDDDFSEY